MTAEIDLIFVIIFILLNNLNKIIGSVSGLLCCNVGKTKRD